MSPSWELHIIQDRGIHTPQACWVMQQGCYGGGVPSSAWQVHAAEHADVAQQDFRLGALGAGDQGALGVGSPVAPGGRTRQNTRMLPLRSCTSLYSRRFSSSVPRYLAATMLSSSTCAPAPGSVAIPKISWPDLLQRAAVLGRHHAELVHLRAGTGICGNSLIPAGKTLVLPGLDTLPQCVHTMLKQM